ncbi:YqaJ viral recombinase family protein [Polynucleobacter sp. AP-RePozz3-80-G7]|uniref:YqaJ viral recombinase family protein n=1 Tax=Polynucleobacter sp. AP-RePozz3-80-G7 TaxID=2689105 RepID=UPI001C0D9F41|nr:YqaJ viral recombinase family protein [Polynucleobacter sp. AP-RePozz3-80-G7]MBU3639990.1 YqaJ viral recombinase family protein [Polynucleobacter sp. AP-RePozz3-80-G7]
MIVHNLVQGSDEWHEFRLTHFGASEAASMLGISKKTSRNELLKHKATGTAKEFSDWVQTNILDYGHEVEALARPLVEALISDELYPVTCSDGKLSASCDGLTMAEDIAFEHKQWSESLAQSIRDGVLPDEHWPQCHQILMITGAQRLIFTVSDGTEDKIETLSVFPDEIKFAMLQAGWAQFEKDLLAYEHREIVEKPKADSIKDFPIATLQAKGELTVTNLGEVLPKFDLFLNSQKTELVTDDDFANGEAVAKFSRETAKKLRLTAKATIDQISSVSDAVRDLEQYADKFDSLGLSLEKLVKSEKDARKNAIVSQARVEWVEHLSGLNSELGKIKLRIEEPNFLEAIRNKRTIESLHNSVDTALANKKVEADAIAKEYRAKLHWVNESFADHLFLFADLQEIIGKPMDDFQVLVLSRVEKHKQIETEKLNAERERIALEERSKASTIMEVAQVKQAPKPISKPAAQKTYQTRPTDFQIIEVLALHWRVHESKVIEWIRDMDLDEATISMLNAI